MYKKIFPLALLGSLFFIGCNINQSQVPPKSSPFDTNATLKKIEIMDNKPEKNKVFERRYKKIPPVISHSIKDKQYITKGTNLCLDCHTNKFKNLQTHYVDNKINPDLYNCLNCHTQSF